MIQAVTNESFWTTPASGALVTGLVVLVIAVVQNWHDSRERRADRESASEIAHKDRNYANLMKLQMSVVRHVRTELSKVMLMAEVAQGHRHGIGEQKYTESAEDQELSFLLAEDEIAQAIVDFDVCCAMLVQWCEARQRNRGRNDEDGWQDNAVLKAKELASLAATVVDLQRKQLGLKPFVGVEDTMLVVIPEVNTE